MRFLLLACLSLLPLTLPAQNRALDSLKRVLRTWQKRDTSYAQMLTRAADNFFATNIDSAHKYAQEALALSEKLAYPAGKAQALRQKGLALRLKGDLTQSFEAYEGSLVLFEAMQNHAGEMAVRNQIGIVYEIQGKYPQALQSYFKALALAERLRDASNESGALNNIGNIYKSQKNFASALEYYQKSLVLKEKIGDKRGMGVSLNNIANVHSMQNDLEKALAYNQRSLAIKEQIQDKRGICVSLGNIGEIYLKQKKPQEALQNYLKSLSIRETLGDKQGISVSQNNIAQAYLALGEYDKALEYAQLALSNAENAHAHLRAGEAMLSLHQIYEKKQDFSNALRYHKRYQAHKDSLFNIDNERKLANASVEREKLEKERERLGREAETRRRQAIEKEQEAERLEHLARFEKDKRIKDSLRNLAQSERLKAERLHAEEAQLRTEAKLKDTEIDRVRTANKLHQAQVKEAEEKAFFRTIINVLMALGLLSVAVFSYFLHRSRQQERKAKELVLVQKGEIQEINQELHSTLAQVREYSEVIEEKNKHITASIQYAQRIQQAILPLPEVIQTHLPESFILFKPRDIVSGDFYYFHEQAGKQLLAAIDCTGHGVPGAFMTMIGYEILNEIVLNKRVISPELVLGELHKSIRKALKQAETHNKDGMDLSMVLIDKAAGKMGFAGAKNQMLYIQQGEIYELKADKMPIGGEQRETERIFTLQEIAIALPTVIYMFSDGYQDQFGGEKKQKFRIAQMKQLFFQHHAEPPEAQRALYEQIIEDWMEAGKEKQIDDILIIGVRL